MRRVDRQTLKTAARASLAEIGKSGDFPEEGACEHPVSCRDRRRRPAGMRVRRRIAAVH